MTVYMQKLDDVLLTASAACAAIEEAGAEAQLGHDFVFAMSLCELVVADPGTCTATRDAVKKVRAKYEKALAKVQEAKAQARELASKAG